MFNPLTAGFRVRSMEFDWLLPAGITTLYTQIKQDLLKIEKLWANDYLVTGNRLSTTNQ